MKRITYRSLSSKAGAIGHMPRLRLVSYSSPYHRESQVFLMPSGGSSAPTDRSRTSGRAPGVSTTRPLAELTQI